MYDFISKKLILIPYIIKILHFRIKFGNNLKNLEIKLKTNLYFK
jgi:hypothetical protein